MNVHFIRMMFGMPTTLYSQGRLRGDVVEHCSTLFGFSDPQLAVTAAIQRPAINAIRICGLRMVRCPPYEPARPDRTVIHQDPCRLEETAPVPEAPVDRVTNPSMLGNPKRGLNRSCRRGRGSVPSARRLGRERRPASPGPDGLRGHPGRDAEGRRPSSRPRAST